MVLRKWPTDDDISEALHLAQTEAIAFLKLVSSSSTKLRTPCELASSSESTSVASEVDEEVSTS